VTEKSIRPDFWIKLTSWEYWPFGIVQFPLFFYWLWLSLKARSFFFFSASNPGIYTGGMLGESKFDVLALVPDAVKPRAIRVRLPARKESVLQQISDAGLELPVVFKPDLGERGWMVRIIRSAQDIDRYLEEIRIDFIVQELVTLPLEFGVFYIRFPDEENGYVNSITGKEFLYVTGDGTSTLQQLILTKDRAKLQWPVLSIQYKDQLGTVLPAGKKLELVPIGNHALGTTFLNGNHLITDKLNASFDSISKQIPGFYFGRYDLRCASLEDLEQGRVKIMELNGCGAEPAHIYHPGAPLAEAVRVMFRHWRDLYRISKQNHLRGVPYISLREGLEVYKRFRALRSAS
jgi:hypothetical protein